MPVEFGALVLTALEGLLAAGSSILPGLAANEISALLKNRRAKKAFERALDGAYSDFESQKEYRDLAGARGLLDLTFVQQIAPELHKLIQPEGEPDLELLVEKHAQTVRSADRHHTREALKYLIARVNFHAQKEEGLRDLLDSRSRRKIAAETRRTADGVEQLVDGVKQVADVLQKNKSIRDAAAPPGVSDPRGETPSGPRVDREKVLNDYLKTIVDDHGKLRLLELISPQKAREMEKKTPLAEKPPSLERVYVPLSTTPAPRGAKSRHSQKQAGGPRIEEALQREGERRVTIGKVLRTNRALAVTGGPGSGKSTLLGHLAICYAKSLLSGDGKDDPVSRKLRLPKEKGFLPIFLPLRRYGVFLVERPESESARDAIPTDGADLLSYAAAYYRSREVAGITRGFFESYLKKGCVFLLDGMDEVPADIRDEVRRRILDLRRVLVSEDDSIEPHRLIVTARPAAIEGAGALCEFHRARILEFDREDQRRFVRYLFTEMPDAGRTRQRGRKAATSLADAFFKRMDDDPHADHLKELAGTPLLLTIMAALYHENVFPPNLTGLLGEATERILRKWDADDGGTTLRRVKLTEEVALDRAQVLNDLHRPLGVFFLDRNNQSVSQEDFVAETARLIQKLGYSAAAAQRAARALVEGIFEERGGLIVWRGPDDFGFLHNDFRDYLAAAHLWQRARNVEDPEPLICEVLSRLCHDHWTELAIPMLIQLLDRPDGGEQWIASQLVDSVLNYPDTPGRAGHNLLLAGRAFLEAQLAKGKPERRIHIRDRLLQSLTDPSIPARMRARLGSLLAEYGDSRPEVTGFPDSMWVDMPAGSCWIGSTAIKAYTDEKPQKYIPFPAFRIMRYPVTQAQYAVFLEERKEHPAPASKAWPDYSWRDCRPPRGKENHPVALVSFADAVAFCEWLSEKLGFEVRLPTEGEWEYAAKGPQSEEERERDYPWGGPFDPEKCNTRESGIGGTSPVGIFPGGARPGGPEEMAGNVWEWTASVYKNYPYSLEDDDGWEKRRTETDSGRTIRGGSWFNPRDLRALRLPIRLPPGRPLRRHRLPVLLQEFGAVGF